MVSMPSWVSILDRKLLRDLWAMKGQAVAIAVVIGAGVTMYVTYLSNFDSLQRTRAAYYQQARFADVFASLTRAPARLEERIAAIPGVATVATRVVADVTLDVSGMPEPAVGSSGFTSVAGGAAVERRVPAPGALDRSGASGRGARERNVLRGAWSRARRSGVGGHQRATSPPDDRWRGVVAGVRVRDSTGRDLPGRAAVWRLLDQSTGRGIGLQSRGSVQRRVARAGSVGVGAGGHRRVGPAARAIWWPRCAASVAAGVGLDAGERAGAARDVRLSRAVHLLRRRGIHSSGGPHPRARAPAIADCGAQGPGLFGCGARVALHQVGAGDRDSRRGHGCGRWCLAGLRNDRALQRVLPFSRPQFPPVGLRGRPVRRREPHRGGAWGASRGSQSRPRSAGRRDAPQFAGAVPCERSRATIPTVATGAGDTHGAAQPRTRARSRFHVGGRHRPRGGGAVHRPRLHRRHQRAHRGTVHPCRAVRRDPGLSRTPFPSRGVRRWRIFQGSWRSRRRGWCR